MARKTSRIPPELIPYMLILPLALVASACGTREVQALDVAGDAGTTGDAGSTADAGGGPADAGTPLPEMTGCDGVKLYATPDDAAARGPWPVGAKTVKVGSLTAEVWYPAVRGSEAGKAQVVYDIRKWLPPPERRKIPDAAAPMQACGCYRDLPIDAAHGKYPVVVFIHGTAGFRTQSLAHMEHWASRGFVVVAADYPGLYLADMLNLNFKKDLTGDTRKVLDALAAPAGDLSLLAGRIDMGRLGMSGHSAGGETLKDFGTITNVRVLIPLAAGGATPSPTLESTLVMGGQIDKIVPYTNQQQGYADSAPLKRLVGVGNAGHLFPTDLCWMTNGAGENLVQVAQKYQITNADLASQLFDCPEGQLPQEKARAIVNDATTAAFEEKLVCRAGSPFAGIQAAYPDIFDFKEEP